MKKPRRPSYAKHVNEGMEFLLNEMYIVLATKEAKYPKDHVIWKAMEFLFANRKWWAEKWEWRKS